MGAGPTDADPPAEAVAVGAALLVQIASLTLRALVHRCRPAGPGEWLRAGDRLRPPPPVGPLATAHRAVALAPGRGEAGPTDRAGARWCRHAHRHVTGIAHSLSVHRPPPPAGPRPVPGESASDSCRHRSRSRPIGAAGDRASPAAPIGRDRDRWRQLSDALSPGTGRGPAGGGGRWTLRLCAIPVT